MKMLRKQNMLLMLFCISVGLAMHMDDPPDDEEMLACGKRMMGEKLFEAMEISRKYLAGVEEDAMTKLMELLGDCHLNKPLAIQVAKGDFIGDNIDETMQHALEYYGKHPSDGDEDRKHEIKGAWTKFVNDNEEDNEEDPRQMIIDVNQAMEDFALDGKGSIEDIKQMMEMVDRAIPTSVEMVFLYIHETQSSQYANRQEEQLKRFAEVFQLHNEVPRYRNALQTAIDFVPNRSLPSERCPDPKLFTRARFKLQDKDIFDRLAGSDIEPYRSAFQAVWNAVKKYVNEGSLQDASMVEIKNALQKAQDGDDHSKGDWAVAGHIRRMMNLRDTYNHHFNMNSAHAEEKIRRLINFFNGEAKKEKEGKEAAKKKCALRRMWRRAFEKVKNDRGTL